MSNSNNRLMLVVPSAAANFNTLVSTESLIWDYKPGMDPGNIVIVHDVVSNMLYYTEVTNDKVLSVVHGNKTLVEDKLRIDGKYPNMVRLKIHFSTTLLKEVYSKFNLKQGASKLLILSNLRKHEWRINLYLDALDSKEESFRNYFSKLIKTSYKGRKGSTYIMGEIRKIFGFEYIRNYKIGFSADPEKRALELSTGNPSEIRLLKVFKDEDTEVSFHTTFSKFKTKKGGTEWFTTNRKLRKLSTT